MTRASPVQTDRSIGWFGLLRIGRRGWWRVLKRTAARMAEMDTSLRCAGVAFFSFLSLFPGVAILVFLIGLLADQDFLVEQIARFADFIPPIALEILLGRVEEIADQPAAGLGVGLVVSVIMVLWSSSRGVNALIYAATAAEPLDQRRGFIASVVMSVVTTILGALFLIVSLGLIAAVPLLTGLSPYPGTAENLALVLRWPLLWLVAMAGISLLYYFTLERRPERLHWLWPGALLASGLWLLACLLFSLYVQNLGNFEATFGSLAGVVVLLFWMHNSALIFVLGATFNAEIERESRRAVGERKS